MRLLIATGNENKVREFRALFDTLGKNVYLESLKDINFTEEIEESGNDFTENSLIKSTALARLGYTAIADDSGLCVDALDGAPGIYSARYAGTKDDNDNIDKLLAELETVPDEKRTARFICVISCVFPKQKKQIVAKGECEGIIIRERRGESGFGYDPVFYIPEAGKTFAEMTEEEKNKISHRGRAMRDFIKKFSDFSDECLKTGRHL